MPYTYSNLNEINSIYKTRATTATYDTLYKQALEFTKLFTLRILTGKY